MSKKNSLARRHEAEKNGDLFYRDSKVGLVNIEPKARSTSQSNSKSKSTYQSTTKSNTLTVPPPTRSDADLLFPGNKNKSESKKTRKSKKPKQTRAEWLKDQFYLNGGVKYVPPKEEPKKPNKYKILDDGLPAVIKPMEKGYWSMKDRIPEPLIFYSDMLKEEDEEIERARVEAEAQKKLDDAIEAKAKADEEALKKLIEATEARLAASAAETKRDSQTTPPKESTATSTATTISGRTLSMQKKKRSWDFRKVEKSKSRASRDKIIVHKSPVKIADSQYTTGTAPSKKQSLKETPESKTEKVITDAIELLANLVPPELDKPYDPIREMKDINLRFNSNASLESYYSTSAERIEAQQLKDEKNPQATKLKKTSKKRTRTPKPKIKKKERNCGIDPGPKDFILLNVIQSIRKPPKIVRPRIVYHHKGHAKDLAASGFARQYVYSENFGKVPDYIQKMKEKIQSENYVTKFMLERRGLKSKDPEEIHMDKAGLLAMQRAGSTTVQKGPISLDPSTLCLMPCSKFHPSINPQCPNRPNCTCSRPHYHIKDKFQSDQCPEKDMVYRRKSQPESCFHPVNSESSNGDKIYYD